MPQKLFAVQQEILRRVRRFSVDKRQYAKYRPKSKTILIQRGLDGQALIGTNRAFGAAVDGLDHGR